MLTASTARADYLWIERAADGMQLRGGELAQPQALTDLRDARAGRGDAPAVTVVPEGATATLPAAGQGDMRASAYRISDRDGQRVITYYQARYGRSETRAFNALELVPTTPDGNTFQLMWKGRAVAPTRVNVDTSAGWQRTLKAAEDGTVTLATPFPGTYVLEVSARIDGEVTLEGRRYEDVRHTATLSFDVPAAPARVP
ncbi:MAG: hypothetical protein QM639_17845 [Rhodocyclaceae bacterium]